MLKKSPIAIGVVSEQQASSPLSGVIVKTVWFEPSTKSVKKIAIGRTTNNKPLDNRQVVHMPMERSVTSWPLHCCPIVAIVMIVT